MLLLKFATLLMMFLFYAVPLYLYFTKKLSAYWTLKVIGFLFIGVTFVGIFYFLMK